MVIFYSVGDLLQHGGFVDRGNAFGDLLRLDSVEHGVRWSCAVAATALQPQQNLFSSRRWPGVRSKISAQGARRSRARARCATGGTLARIDTSGAKSDRNPTCAGFRLIRQLLPKLARLRWPHPAPFFVIYSSCLDKVPCFNVCFWPNTNIV